MRYVESPDPADGRATFGLAPPGFLPVAAVTIVFVGGIAVSPLSYSSDRAAATVTFAVPPVDAVSALVED